MRADINVSVRKPGATLGTRCEIKNVNSIRFIGQAIEHEARRQIEILEDGGSIHQETRLFDAKTGETRSMRSKEEAHDYRYFPDPDLLPLELDARLCELARRTCLSCPIRSGRGSSRPSGFLLTMPTCSWLTERSQIVSKKCVRSPKMKSCRAERSCELGHKRVVRPSQ